MVSPSCSSRRNSSQVAHSRTRLELAIRTRGAHSWVRKTPTGLPDWTSIVSSSPSVRSVRDDRVEGLPGPRRPARSLRRRRGRRAARRPRGRGCSSASASPPPAASRGRRSRLPRGARTGRGAAHSSSPTAPSTAASEAGGDEPLGGRQLRGRATGQVPAPGDAGRPHARQRRAGAGAGLERRPQVEAARGGTPARRRGCAPRLEIDRAQLAGRAPAHRHVVLLHRARRAASRRSPAPRGAGSRRPSPPACTGRSSARSCTPASSARNGGRPCERRRVEQAVGAPLGDRPDLGARRSPGSRTPRPRGAPWKFPHDSTRPSGRTIGLSIAEASSASATRRA